MPRKATKSTGAPASRSSSKRPAPEVPARQSKRARAAIRKSYVEPESDTDNEDRPKKVQLSNGDYDDDEGVAVYLRYDGAACGADVCEDAL